MAAPYYDDSAYIDEIVRSAARGLAKIDFEPEAIIVSFHGMSLETLIKGDPYFDQCHRTADLMRRRLGSAGDRLFLTFQSRFGRAEWLKPYTDETIKQLAANGVKRIAVITPGFSADCLETIEEIGRENKNHFLAGGGQSFARIDCLNDTDGGMRVIEAVVRRELSGWI